MNKAQLVDVIASETKLTKVEVELVVNTLIETVSNELIKGNKVTIKGFGTFDSFERKPSKGRVVGTGEVVDIPSHRVPRFRISSKLKNKVRENS